MAFKDDQVQEISKEWSNFLQKNSKFTLLQNDSFRITTPFTDSFGDGIVINVHMAGNKYILSDQGYTIWNLTTNGIDVMKSNSNRKRILNSLLKPYGIDLTEDAVIQQSTTRKELSQSITDMTQVLINVSDLAFFNHSNTASVFYDDVKAFFDSNREIYSFIGPIFAPGKSYVKYRFEYLFTPKSNDFRLMKLYTNLSKNTMDIIIGIWSDTKQFRDDNYGSNATINVLVDGLDAKSRPFADGLSQHGINVYDFKDKDAVRKNLAMAK
jgi:uncharacterized protein YegP (UPF0339 family)